MDDRKRIYQNTGWKIVQQAATGFTEFLTMLFLAKLLKPESYGLLALSLSVIGAFQLFANFGIGQSTTKFIAEYQAKESQKVKSFLLSGLLLSTSFGILAGIICLLGAKYVSIWFSNNKLQTPLQIGALLIIFENLRMILEAIFKGFQEFKPPAMASVVSRPSEVVMVLSAVFFGYGIVGAITGMVAGRLIANIFLLKKLGRFISWNKRVIFGDEFLKNLKQVAEYSFPIALSIFGYYFYNQIDIIFLGYFSDARQVAYYSFAKLFYMLPAAVLIAYSMAIGPFVAGEFGNRNKKKIQSMFEEVETISILFIFPIALSIFVFCEPIIKWGYPSYGPSILLIRILSIFLIMLSFSKVCEGGFLISTGNAPLLAKIILLGAFLKVTVNLLLIPKYGALGAVEAVVIVQTIIVFCILYFTLRKLELRFRFKPRCVLKFKTFLRKN